MAQAHFTNLQPPG